MTRRFVISLSGALLFCGAGAHVSAQTPSETTSLNQAVDSARAANDPALFDAAAAGNCRAVEAALNAGANIDARNANGQTPLMVAVLAGRTDVVRMLIARHADVNLKDNDGRTAVSIALRGRTGNTPGPSADPNKSVSVAGSVRTFERTAQVLNLSASAASAARGKGTSTAIGTSGRVAANAAGSMVGNGVAMLFGRRAGRMVGSMTRTVVRGATNLTADAASAVQSGKVRKAVTTGYAAVARRAENAAERVISTQAGDGPSLGQVRKSAGMDAASLLTTVRSSLKTPDAQALLSAGNGAMASGSGLDFRNAAAWAPLIVSAAKSDPKLLVGLLTSVAGTSLDQQKNILMLIAAAVKSDASLADGFFNRSGDPQAESRSQELVQAAFADNLSLIRSLILSGEGDPFSAIAFEALRTATGVLFPTLPGQITARTGMTQEDASRVTAIVSMLLDAGGDPNTRDSNGMTALMWAAQTGSIAAAKILLAHGANRSLVDADGLTALQHALSTGTRELADLLQP